MKNKAVLLVVLAGLLSFYGKKKMIETLARTIWGEAWVDGRQGMQAVANVIMNRVSRSRWPDTVTGVAFQRWQFSLWNKGDNAGEKARKADYQTPGFRDALEIAERAIKGSLPDITGGSDHYYAYYIKAPKWSHLHYFTRRMGHHLFFDSSRRPTGATKLAHEKARGQGKIASRLRRWIFG